MESSILLSEQARRAEAIAREQPQTDMGTAFAIGAQVGFAVGLDAGSHNLEARWFSADAIRWMRRRECGRGYPPFLRALKSNAPSVFTEVEALLDELPEAKAAPSSSSSLSSSSFCSFCRKTGWNCLCCLTDVFHPVSYDALSSPPVVSPPCFDRTYSGELFRLEPKPEGCLQCTQEAQDDLKLDARPLAPATSSVVPSVFDSPVIKTPSSSPVSSFSAGSVVSPPSESVKDYKLSQPARRQDCGSATDLKLLQPASQDCGPHPRRGCGERQSAKD